MPLRYSTATGADVTTTEEMVLAMERKYGKANRIWVMDRGMVSEENIEFMKERGARYIVGTPKSMLRKFEQDLLAKGWEEVHPGVEVKICSCAEGGEETFVMCRSEGRKDKETAILNRFITATSRAWQTQRTGGKGKTQRPTTGGTKDRTASGEKQPCRFALYVTVTRRQENRGVLP